MRPKIYNPGHTFSSHMHENLLCSGVMVASVHSEILGAASRHEGNSGSDNLELPWLWPLDSDTFLMGNSDAEMEQVLKCSRMMCVCRAHGVQWFVWLARVCVRRSFLHFSHFVLPIDNNICRTNSLKTCKTPFFGKIVLRAKCSAPPRHPTLAMRSMHPACQTCQMIRSITVQSLKGHQGVEQRGKVGKLTTTVVFPFEYCR